MIEGVALQWTDANLYDPSLSGFKGLLYVGQVVRYDVPPGWHGFVHG